MTTAPTAQEVLDDLLSRAEAGENIAPERLAAARAAVELEQVAATGRARREAEEAARVAAERRAAAKTTANSNVDKTEKAFANARKAFVKAMVELVAAVEQHTAEVYRAASALEQAGVPAHQDHHVNPDVDPNWAAVYGFGDTSKPRAVRLNGVEYHPVKAGRVVVDTLRDGLREVGAVYPLLKGLPVDYERSLEGRLGHA